LRREKIKFVISPFEEVEALRVFDQRGHQVAFDSLLKRDASVHACLCRALFRAGGTNLKNAANRIKHCTRVVRESQVSSKVGEFQFLVVSTSQGITDP
jgi:hypothetical protein